MLSAFWTTAREVNFQKWTHIIVQRHEKGILGVNVACDANADICACIFVWDGFTARIGYASICATCMLLNQEIECH